MDNKPIVVEIDVAKNLARKDEEIARLTDTVRRLSRLVTVIHLHGAACAVPGRGDER